MGLKLDSPIPQTHEYLCLVKANYLIVGQGIAGSAMAIELLRRGKSVVVINKEGKSLSSNVAAGVYNPFNFRRMIPTWEAVKACRAANELYSAAEAITGATFHEKKQIVRIFPSAQERDAFIAYCAKDDGFFAGKFIGDPLPGKVNAPHGAGTINGGGVVNTAAYMYAVQQYFAAQNAYRDEWFDSEKLIIESDKVVYDDRITTDKIVFCEGHLALENPLFPELPLAPTKGEIIHVSIPDLNLEQVLNGPVYLAPLGNDLYDCGATFNPGKADENVTPEGREELLRKLSGLLSIPFRPESQFAGVRPAGRDRKPLVGVHPVYRHVGMLNGSGSKGILLTPLLAQSLVDHMETGAEIPLECDIIRFKKTKKRR